jgi:hypothetical protein
VRAAGRKKREFNKLSKDGVNMEGSDAGDNLIILGVLVFIIVGGIIAFKALTAHPGGATVVLCTSQGGTCVEASKCLIELESQGKENGTIPCPKSVDVCCEKT